MDPAAAAAGEEEGGEKPPVIYTMENKPIVTCECGRAGRAEGRRPPNGDTPQLCVRKAALGSGSVAALSSLVVALRSLGVLWGGGE